MHAPFQCSAFRNGIVRPNGKDAKLTASRGLNRCIGRLVRRPPQCSFEIPKRGKVAIFSADDYWRKSSLLTRLEQAGLDYHCVDSLLTRDSAPLASQMECEVVCCFVNDTLDAEVLTKLSESGVKLVALRCAGFDRVDLEAAERLGVKVVRVPSYSPHAVAEHAVALLLALNRRIHKAYTRCREGNFRLSGLVGFNVKGKTVGIVGTGKIGVVTAQILSGFGCDLLAYDIREDPEALACGCQYVALEQELIARSDIISLHLPLLESTHHIIDADKFNMMKKGAILVNVSRGGLINAKAALDSLRSGHLGGLALDVYEKEQGTT
eukprot:scaffold990_cov393-Prasinococcus_capsulatus_cf.AAC.5